MIVVIARQAKWAWYYIVFLYISEQKINQVKSFIFYYIA